MELGLKDKIQAILFYKGEEILESELSKMLDVSEEDINNGLNELEEEIKGRGVVLMRRENKVALATNSEMSELIDGINKEELNKEIGNAGIETLSIILYKSPVSKTEIDYIRGVNSASILRNLLIRGLIEKETLKENKRINVYKPSLDTFSFLGITKIEEIPAYEEVKNELEEFLKETQNERQ